MLFDPKLKEQYPLPENLEDVEVSQTDLAPLLGVSENTLTDWRKNQAMPVKEEGGNGRAYVFQLSEVWAWYKNRESERANEDAKRRDVLAAARMELFPDGEILDATAGMSPADRIKFYQAEEAWLKTSEFRKAYCSRAAVRDLIEPLLTIIRDGISSYPNTLENEAALTPKQVAAVVAHGDRLLASLKSQIAESDLLTIDADDVTSAIEPAELPLN